MNRIRNLLAGLALSFALFGAAPMAHAQMSEQTVQASERLDLNTATVDQLTSLPGIGPSKAEAIVSYRQNRPFRRVEDLVRVRGIGRALYRSLRDRVSVSDAAPTRRGRRARR